MMNVKRELEMNKIALAAFVLGVFALSPAAFAEPDLGPLDVPTKTEVTKKEDPKKGDPKKEDDLVAADEDLRAATPAGLKWGQLKQIAPDLEVKIVDGMLTLNGSIPAACAKDRSMSDIVSADDKHSLTIDMPNCRNGTGHLKGAERAKKVTFSSAFPAKAFQDMDGKFCLKYSTSGDDGTMKCDPILVGGKVLVHQSRATAAALSAEEALKAQRKASYDKHEQIVLNVGKYCRAGRTNEMNLELEAAAIFFGDIQPLLEEIGQARVKQAKSAMAKAKTPEELKLAYQNILEQNGDTEKAEKEFRNLRMAMFKKLESVKDLSVSKLDDEVASLEADLAEMADPDAEQDVRDAAAFMYSIHAKHNENEKNFDKAEELYMRSMKYLNSEKKLEAEREMSKMLMAAADGCLEENKLRPAKCDAYRNKAEKHGRNAVAMLKKQKKEYAAEYIELLKEFGPAPNYKFNVAGYGALNPYGGAWDQRKMQTYRNAYTTAMQEAQMRFMMQQQAGVMGTTIMPGGMQESSSGGLLR